MVDQRSHFGSPGHGLQQRCAIRLNTTLTTTTLNNIFFADIVREILENRAEIYKALHKESSTDETEEEGPSVEDMILQDHVRLQKEIKSKEQSNTVDKNQSPILDSP